jgi:hypothetical protein
LFAKFGSDECLHPFAGMAMAGRYWLQLHAMSQKIKSQKQEKLNRCMEL